jgi:hypothetical protein
VAQRLPLTKPVANLSGDCQALLVVVDSPTVLSKVEEETGQVAERIPHGVAVTDLSGDF